MTCPGSTLSTDIQRFCSFRPKGNDSSISGHSLSLSLNQENGKHFISTRKSDNGFNFSAIYFKTFANQCSFADIAAVMQQKMSSQ